MDMEQFRLTDEEIRTVLTGLPNGTYGEGLRGIADATTEKALRSVLLWLREFERMHSRPEEFIAIGRGHGLEMAANELEEMLKRPVGGS